MNKHNERAELIRQFEQSVHRKGELWERCQGKGWPQSESDEFHKLRDETVPKLRAAMMEAQPAEPVYCGDGCSCVTVCGDTYDYLGTPRPPEKPAEQAKGQEAVARVVGGNHPGATPWVRWQCIPYPKEGTLLYTTPPAQPAREWVGLTENDIGRLRNRHMPPTTDRDYVFRVAVQVTAAWLREKNAGLPAAVPDGWHFYTADFSMQACGKSAIGSVMLIRDMEGQKAWHALGDEDKERVELYVSGKGATVLEAVADASSNAMLAAAPKPQPPADDHPLMHSKPAKPQAPDMEASE